MASSTMEAVVATPREGKFNKNAARRVRVAGKIPAVVYGAGQDAVAVAVDPKVITRILHSDSGHNTIFDLNVEGSAVVKAMIVDWQNEPIKGTLLHIDLKRIAMDKTIIVSVPIQLVGVPVGVKSQGGILEHVMREVEIECLPNDIPSHLDVDVSNLELHGIIHVSDLPHSGSIKFLGEEGATVAHVTIIKEEVVAVEAVVVAPTEPEVAKKGKTDAAAPAAPAADAKDAKKK
ncbi:50S ribosomal protein L25 [Tunturibacter empetritectus]|uniref:Large ribosomal subunit protein bL25 n=1 Tax=Tunturiibacter empetritectus TaxID=3069691 RepID=A0A7W8MSS1_9BACT|nr:50S ribosomal protein L25 [Edaphobacter lichenicola]MBB5317474.1 large subunit ribosomal protein L25 [Edaphobacter lichenicola]